jgi:type IVB pilus formation R64 PilN family outer membrane protein
MAEQRALQGAKEVSNTNQPYLLGSQVRVAETTHLPGVFKQTVHLATSQPLSIGQLATQLTQMTGMPVHVASQVKTFLSGSTMQQQPQAMPALPGQRQAYLPPVSLPNVSKHNNVIALNWNGSLSGLLNLVATRTGTFWKYSHGSVRFFLTETKAFTVNALPGSTTLTSNISNAGSAGAGGTGLSANNGSTSQTVGMASALDIYKSIVTGIKTVLVQSAAITGGSSMMSIPTSVAANPSTGQIIVTASPPELRAVAAYLKPVNKEMSKNVMIDVHIYSVQLTNANDYGLNVSAVLNSVAHNYGYGLKVGGPGIIAPPTSQTGNILGNLSADMFGPPNGSSVGAPSSMSSTMVAQALATQGNVSLVTSGSIIALNGQPTPLQVAQETSYLASTATTQMALGGGSSTQLTPGEFTTGFSGTFLPLIRGKHVLLEYTLNLTQNTGLQTFTTNGSTIELPNLATQAFMQRVNMKSGETLVLSGFEDAKSETANQGMGTPGFWGLGGGANAQNRKNALVIVIHLVALKG